MSLLYKFLFKCTDFLPQQVEGGSLPLPVTQFGGQQGEAVAEIALGSP